MRRKCLPTLNLAICKIAVAMHVQSVLHELVFLYCVMESGPATALTSI